MKLLYVADNSDRMNWGCRATSLALAQMIARGGEISGRVMGAEIERRYPVSDVVGDRAFAMLASVFNRGRMRALPLAGPLIARAMDALGRDNAIGHDLDANIEALLRARAYSPEARALFTRLEACDAVVVNGEGDLIFGVPARHRLLYTLTVCALALKTGKALYYLNAMASPAPDGGVDRPTLALAAGVLAQARDFSVRDPHSLEFIRREMPGLAVRMAPDALFSWSALFAGSQGAGEAGLAPFFENTGCPIPQALRGPYVAVGGSSLAAADQRRAADAYTGLVRALQPLGLPVVLAPGCNGDAFLGEVSRRTGATLLPLDMPILAAAATLGHARLYVSGRWHPSIMASLGGAPCIFLGSNSHKTLAIQTLLEYPHPHEFDAFPTPADAEAVAAEAAGLLARGEELRAAIVEVSRRRAAEANTVTDRLRADGRDR